MQTAKAEARQDVKVSEIERNVIQAAINRNPFYTFASLRHYFPHVSSIRDFITSQDYLGGLEITFQGDLEGLADDKAGKLSAMLGLLTQIEAEIRRQRTDYRRHTRLHGEWVREVFKDKVLKFDDRNPRKNGEVQFRQFVSSKDWFAFDTTYGTSEERAFVDMLDRYIRKSRRNTITSICCATRDISPSITLPMVRHSNRTLSSSCERKTGPTHLSDLH